MHTRSPRLRRPCGSDVRLQQGFAEPREVPSLPTPARALRPKRCGSESAAAGAHSQFLSALQVRRQASRGLRHGRCPGTALSAGGRRRALRGLAAESLASGTPQSSTGGPDLRGTIRSLLSSADVTWSLSDRQNLRLAAYDAVARPDPREVSPDYYAQGYEQLWQPRRLERFNVRESSTPTCAGALPGPGELLFHNEFSEGVQRSHRELLAWLRDQRGPKSTTPTSSSAQRRRGDWKLAGRTSAFSAPRSTG